MPLSLTSCGRCLVFEACFRQTAGNGGRFLDQSFEGIRGNLKIHKDLTVYSSRLNAVGVNTESFNCRNYCLAALYS